MKSIIKQVVKTTKIFSSKSLSFQLFCLELSLIILVIITIFFVFIRTTNQIYDQNYKYVNDIIEQMENNISTHLNSINNIMYSVSFNDDIKTFLESTEDIERLEVSYRVNDYLTGMKSLKNEIQEIGLFGTDDFRYNLGYDIRVINQIKNLIQKIEKGSQPQYLGIINNGHKKEIVFGNNIYSEERTLNQIGYLIILVDKAIFTEELKSKFGEYYIVDDNKKIIMSLDESKIGQPITSYTNVVSRENDWKMEMPLQIVGINTKKQITTDIVKTRSAYMIIIGIMFLMMLLTYIFVSKYSVKPLNKVSEFINTISGGDLRCLSKRMIVQGPQEIRMITNEINYLLDEVNNLSHRLVTTTSHLYNIELDKKKAELDYLKSQVNPHFLYNTLGIIKGIATVKGEEEIKHITNALVEIFRYSIKGEDFVEFSQELRVVKAYIKIQKIRFHNRFNVEYKIEPHLMEMKVQKMILQPIIENAIFHGIEPKLKKSMIIIEAFEDEEGVKIYVKDDGIGIEEEKLHIIRKQLNRNGNELWKDEHIGMMNVHTRLRHIYGGESGITLQSKQDRGTTVCLFIPSDKIDSLN